MLTIEAMQIAHRGCTTTMALITSDRDFTPLALRLRSMGLEVLGFGKADAGPSFQAACTHFQAIIPARITAPVPQPASLTPFTPPQVLRLRRAVQVACHASGGQIILPALRSAILAAEPELVAKLTGKGRFLRTLEAYNIVERLGSGPALMVCLPRLRSA